MKGVQVIVYQLVFTVLNFKLFIHLAISHYMFSYLLFHPEYMGTCIFFSYSTVIILVTVFLVINIRSWLMCGYNFVENIIPYLTKVFRTWCSILDYNRKLLQHSARLTASAQHNISWMGIIFPLYGDLDCYCDLLFLHWANNNMYKTSVVGMSSLLRENLFTSALFLQMIHLL